jgi:hypothetical protein
MFWGESARGCSLLVEHWPREGYRRRSKQGGPQRCQFKAPLWLCLLTNKEGRNWKLGPAYAMSAGDLICSNKPRARARILGHRLRRWHFPRRLPRPSRIMTVWLRDGLRLCRVAGLLLRHILSCNIQAGVRAERDGRDSAPAARREGEQ